MSARIEHLKNCLSGKEALLEQLLLILEDEQSCITGHDVDGVESTCQRKLRLFDLLDGKTRECRLALQYAADELKISSEPRLSLIISALETPASDNLMRMQQRILQLGDAVDRSNRQNRDLLYGSLKAVISSLEYFSGNQLKSSTYGNTGRMTPGTTGGRLLHGEI